MFVHLFVCGDRNIKFIQKYTYCHSVDNILCGFWYNGFIIPIAVRGIFVLLNVIFMCMYHEIFHVQYVCFVEK